MIALKNDFTDVYRFKIELQYIRPKIWREIEVPGNYSFWDLHVAITNVMGWHDYHLHQFTIEDPNTGDDVMLLQPNEEDLDWGIETRDDHEEGIADYFSMANWTCEYEYDFGDSWMHLIILEEISERDWSYFYPLFLDGWGTCPPEDVGGPGGYKTFLKVLEDPENIEHDHYKSWVGWNFDPDAFNPQQVTFADPEKWYKFLYG